MSTEIEEFMIKVGKQLKKSPEAMQPFIDKLNDNWNKTYLYSYLKLHTKSNF